MSQVRSSQIAQYYSKSKRGNIHKVNIAAASQSTSGSLCPIEPVFEAFVYSGCVPLGPAEIKPVHVLRHTGAAQSFVFESVLPFSETSCAGSDVLIQGIELAVIHVPLYTVY